MISIKRNTSSNPFVDYPQLMGIGPEPYISIAQEAVAEEMASIAQYGESHADGQIYLILKDIEVIGITGYFLWGHDLGLRWHGITHPHRGCGYSSQVLCAVLMDAIQKQPQARLLIEIVPQTAYGKPLERHFQKLGFESYGYKEKYDWSQEEWQPYKLDIHRFLLNHEPALSEEPVLL